MKQLVYIFVICLAGCTSWIKEYLPKEKNLLDTAPKSAEQVRYPDWGYVESTQKTRTQAEMSASVAAGDVHSHSLKALRYFLAANGIDYEILSGNFSIIHIKKPILFDVNSASVRADTRPWLKKIGDYLASHREIEVVVDGHTDSRGDAQYNDALSKQRANAVRSLIIGDWQSSSVVYTRGFGAEIPTCADQSCNRRVEMYFIVPS